MPRLFTQTDQTIKVNQTKDSKQKNQSDEGNQSNQTKVLSENLVIADTLFSRTKGLLGRESLPAGEILWIHRCNSIHTFFMKFAIDCVFLNSSLQVCSIKKDVRPWRIIWPQWGARSVLEMKSGEVDRLNIKKGDTLHVGP